MPIGGRGKLQGLLNSNHQQEVDIRVVSDQLEIAPSPGEGAWRNRRAIPAGAEESRWIAPDGFAIRRIDWPAAGGRGSLLFLPGRGDAYEKYLETLDYWAERGWRVTAMDWRGQAGSGRLGYDAVTGHVGDFGQWIDDLAAFWRDWINQTPGPHVLVGHSMGGHLVLRAAAEGWVDPAALVLSTPMLGLAGIGVPPALLSRVAWAMARIGDARRPAWKWSERPGEPPEGRSRLLTHDESRYADELWWRKERPETAMGPGSWGWLDAAYRSMNALSRAGALEKVRQPVLILGTRIDRLVDFGAMERAVRRLPQGELIAFGEEARHEILRESDPVRDRALSAIDDFLDRVVPAGNG